MIHKYITFLKGECVVEILTVYYIECIIAIPVKLIEIQISPMFRNALHFYTPLIFFVLLKCTSLIKIFIFSYMPSSESTK